MFGHRTSLGFALFTLFCHIFSNCSSYFWDTRHFKERRLLADKPWILGVSQGQRQQSVSSHGKWHFGLLPKLPSWWRVIKNDLRRSLNADLRLQCVAFLLPSCTFHKKHFDLHYLTTEWMTQVSPFHVLLLQIQTFEAFNWSSLNSSSNLLKSSSSVRYTQQDGQQAFQWLLEGILFKRIQLCDNSHTNILPCVNFNSFRWKQMLFMWLKAGLWNFSGCSSGAVPVWVASRAHQRHTVDTRRAEARASPASRWFQMMNKQLWHILRRPESLSFFTADSLSSDELRAHPWRPLCPALWWLISPPSRCWSLACRLSRPLNHSTCMLLSCTRK